MHRLDNQRAFQGDRGEHWAVVAGKSKYLRKEDGRVVAVIRSQRRRCDAGFGEDPGGKAWTRLGMSGRRVCGGDEGVVKARALQSMRE